MNPETGLSMLPTMHETFPVFIPLCTFSSVLFLNPLLTNMESVVKASVEFLIYILLYNTQLSLRGPGLSPYTQHQVSLDLHAVDIWLSFFFFAVFSLHFIPASNLCFSHWGEKAWLSSGAWVFILRLMTLSCENGFCFPFSFLLFSVQDNPVLTAR